ncbi:MAG: hypothetical protein IGS50_07930 [Synechococcales cyanobacterium C42_A2020_086]|nr:hypothetical protein [Synechococcales cyanobacterium C42_A2020_086]
MRVWLICLVLFWGVAELYQWLHELALSPPCFVAAGIALAVVSNRSGRQARSVAASSGPHKSSPSAAASLAESVKVAAVPSQLSTGVTSLSPPGAQLPSFNEITPTSQPSISFTIRRSPSSVDPSSDS